MLLLGILMIIAGIVLLMVESMHEQRYEERGETTMPPDRRGEIRGGAVVMIGPLPLIISSDQRTAAILMVLAISLMALWLIYVYLVHLGVQ